MQCSICLDDFGKGLSRQRKTLICGHAFHHDCIERALDFSITACPLCRRAMTPTRVSGQPVIAEIISNVLFGYVTIMCGIFTYIFLCAAMDLLYSCVQSLVAVRV